MLYFAGCQTSVFAASGMVYVVLDVVARCMLRVARCILVSYGVCCSGPMACCELHVVCCSMSKGCSELFFCCMMHLDVARLGRAARAVRRGCCRVLHVAYGASTLLHS